MKTLIGTGIFMWNASERRSNRYGMFFMCDATIDKDYDLVPTFDLEAAGRFVGKNVKLTCRVTENRKSGHFGDAFLGIVPSMPEVNEIIVIGVGPCYLEVQEYSPSGWQIGIKPSDAREEFWFDPRKWYRLHDQTVELFIEETDEPEHADPSSEIHSKCEGEVISNGDGTVQFKGSFRAGEKITVAPNIVKLPFGDGTFLMEMPHATGNAGKCFKVVEK